MRKDGYITIRIEPELKDKFYNECQKNAINPSEWIRLQIKKFVENKKIRE